MQHLEGLDLIAEIQGENEMLLRKIRSAIEKIHNKGYVFSRISFVDGSSIYSGFAFIGKPRLCHTFSFPRVIEIADAFLFYHNLDESPEAPDDFHPNQEVACTDAHIDDFLWVIEDSRYRDLFALDNRLDFIMNHAGSLVSIKERTSGVTADG